MWISAIAGSDVQGFGFQICSRIADRALKQKNLKTLPKWERPARAGECKLAGGASRGFDCEDSACRHSASSTRCFLAS
jgi:hypothetical protein